MEVFLKDRSLTAYFLLEESEQRRRAIQAMTYVTTEDLVYPAADESVVIVEIASSIDPFSALEMIKDAVAGRRIGHVDVPVNEKYL